MTPPSILFCTDQDRASGRPSAPDFFTDLNLDQIVASVTAGKDEYHLTAYFHSPLQDADAIVFRQKVMQDLERPELFGHIKAFAESMRVMREHLARAEKLRYRLQKQRWFLDAAGVYCKAVTRLAEDLSRAQLAARGCSAFREYVTAYAASRRFRSLLGRTEKLTADLAAIRYTVLIDAPHVQVRRYEDESDYGAEIGAVFDKFKQGRGREYAFRFTDSADVNHVEARILEQVAKVYSDTFSELENYVEEHEDFADPAIVVFDREVQFYVAYLEYLAPFRNAGLNFCYPRVTRTSKEIYDYGGFDLALAGRLIGQNTVPVCNDFHLKGRERIIVVSGPNQGGKTTFARTFGQLHYLASLGCPVPGRQAQLFLFDELFAHFEKEENVANLHGKLHDDLARVHDILERTTPRSIIILNEIFTSTTFRDASRLSREIAGQIMQLDVLCVWVTFIDELASLSENTVSMVSTVVPDNPAQRTFRIIRQPADGLAYTLSIAEKHRLTYDMIKKRMRT